jgi:hypothetical protein
MDPNPFKHPAVVLARLRDGIEPALFAAGFSFDGRNKPDRPFYLFLDYARGDTLFRLARDRRDNSDSFGFVAELMEPPDRYVSIAILDCRDLADWPPASLSAEIQVRMDAFVATVNSFLRERFRASGQAD